MAAAGESRRMGLGTSKLLLKIGNLSVLERSLQSMLDSELFSLIVILTREAERPEIELLARPYAEKYRTKIELVTGGRSRQQSVFNGLQYIHSLSFPNASSVCVVVHDAARCLVSAKLMRAAVESAAQNQACTAALPVVDTLRRIKADNQISEPVERDGVWSIQTPQAFRFDLLYQAHKRALELGIEATDDAALVEPLHAVKLLPGELGNIKITTLADLEFAEKILVDRIPA